MKRFAAVAVTALFTAAGLGATAAQQSPAQISVSAEATVTVGALEISKAFTKAMLPGQPVGGGYLTIRNTGGTDDRLMAASSPSAGAVELHEMAMQGDVMRMRKLEDGITIPAGETVELTPGGLHLMFMKVKEPFKNGGSVVLTLTFEKAGSVDVVLPVGAAGPAGHQHH